MKSYFCQTPKGIYHQYLKFHKLYQKCQNSNYHISLKNGHTLFIMVKTYKNMVLIRDGMLIWLFYTTLTVQMTQALGFLLFLLTHSSFQKERIMHTSGQGVSNNAKVKSPVTLKLSTSYILYLQVFNSLLQLYLIVFPVSIVLIFYNFQKQYTKV